MSEELRLNADLADDKMTADVCLTRGDETIVMKVDAAMLDRLIFTLGSIRSAMLPAFPDHMHVEHIINADAWRWQVPQMRIDGKRSLAVRHPGFGWLAFEIDDEPAAEIASYLTKAIASDTPAGSA